MDLLLETAEGYRIFHFVLEPKAGRHCQDQCKKLQENTRKFVSNTCLSKLKRLCFQNTSNGRTKLLFIRRQ